MLMINDDSELYGTSERSGGDIVSSLSKFTSNIKFPFQKFEGEVHLPGMNFAGPGTRLDLRLNDDLTPKDWSKPIDRVDEAAYYHDLAYSRFNDTANRNEADRIMVRDLDNIQNPTLRESAERAIVKPIIATKAKFGLGMDGIEMNHGFGNFQILASEMNPP